VPDPCDPHAADRVDPITRMTNGSHILARGDTHLAFALPRYGTPCAALLTPGERKQQSEYAAAMVTDRESGTMSSMPARPDEPHHDEADTSRRAGY